MARITRVVAAANATVGTNLLSGDQRQTSGSAFRQVTRLMLVGSTNPADTEVELFYGSTSLGKFRNSRGGANLYPQPDTDAQDVDGELALEPGEPLNAFVTVAPTTNQIVLTLDVEEVG